MKVSWPHTDEYATLYESAEWQREDRLAGPRVIVYGLIGWVMVFGAWACMRLSRFFN